MRLSVLACLAVVFVACAAAHEATAHADQIKHPSGFTFELPRIGTDWAQETRGDLLMIQDDTDKLPELQLFVFEVQKPGALMDVVARLPAEVIRPGVELTASAVSSAKLVGATSTRTIADARVATGALILNARDKAVFAVILRKDRALVVLAVPKEGIYARGVSTFRSVIDGLAPIRQAGSKRASSPSIPPASVMQLEHPAGFTFVLPKPATTWTVQSQGDLIIVRDGKDSDPALEIFVFSPTREGTLAELRARLPGELARPGIVRRGRALTRPKVGSFEEDAIRDAKAEIGVLLFNKDEEGGFAIVQRGGRSLILIGIPSDATFRQGSAIFRDVVNGLVRARAGAPRSRAPAAAPVSAPDQAVALPALPPIVGIARVTATSTFGTSKQDLYGAWRTLEYASVEDRQLGEPVPTTAWCEGTPGAGVGEGLTIEFATPTQLDAIQIAAGVWKTAKLFAGNNRISALAVTFDGTTITVRPSTKRAWLEVPVRRVVSRVTIKIAAVARGRMNDSCLSGIQLVRAGAPMAVVRGVDAAALQALPRALAAIQQALAAPGRAGLQPWLAFPFVVHDAAGFFEGDPAPVTYATWPALAAACARAERLRTPAALLTCPGPAQVDIDDDRAAVVQPAGPGQLEVVFPAHREVQELWRLRWQRGAWRLAAIDHQ